MKLSRLHIILILIITFLIAIFLLNSDYKIITDKAAPIDFLGQIAFSEGQVSFKDKPQSQFSSELNYPQNIFNKSQIKTGSSSKAQINVATDWVLELSERTQTEFQYWGSGASQKVLMHIIDGEYKIITKGTKNNLLILNKAQFYNPGDAFTKKQPLALELIKNKIVNAQEANNTQSEDNNDNLKNNLPRTRDDEFYKTTKYIENSVFKKRQLFEKCLANRLRQQNNISGRLLVGFNVTKQGELKKINIIDNKTQDKKIESCILDVFSQIKIRNYNGPKTFFAFPIDFK